MFGKVIAIISSTIIAVFGFFGSNSGKSTVTQQPIQSQILLNKLELFNAVNNYRDESKLTRITPDNEACKIAERIIEKYWWLTNYNTSDYLDLCPECNSLAVTLAQDMSDTTSILSSWKTNTKTNENIKKNYKYGCVEIIDKKIALILVNKNSANTIKPSILPSINPNPLISCGIHANCGGGSRQMKKNECDNMTCCNFDQKCGGSKFVTKIECNNSYCCYLRDGTARLLSSKSACDNYYSNGTSTNTSLVPNCFVYYSALKYTASYYNVSTEQCKKWQDEAKSTTSSYSPCTVYYPVLNRSETYNYLSPEQCLKAQSDANSYPTSVSTTAPRPTTDPTLCANAVAEWRKYVEDFNKNKYNNYSSSAEAIMALEADRQVIQNQINSYGCTNVLRLN